MTMGYVRAVMDRADTDTEGGGPIRFVAATEGTKADSIDLRMSGANLERYRANPVFLFGHRYYSREDLPIGRAVDIRVDGARLLIDVEFDTADPFAQEVERKYRGGFMNAVSIGFDVHAWENGVGSYWKGGVAEKWELLELSAVPVPMDANAVVESGRAAGGLLTPQEVRDVIREEFARLAPAPADDRPAPAGIDNDAAQGLLAAFTLKGTSDE